MSYTPMNNTTYWHKQTAENPLYKDFEWNKPERQSERGKLGIIGGQSSGFIAVAESYNIAKSSKIGQVKSITSRFFEKNSLDFFRRSGFVYGKFNRWVIKEAESDVMALIKWSDVCLMIGDSGKGSETAICYENTISKTESPIIITRDAVDLLLNSVDLLLSKRSVALVLSFAQNAKIV
jgi:phosphomevalonate kinase